MPVRSPGIPAAELRPQEGEVFCVDKPKGWTSFDVVKKVKHLLGIRKVGHTGTLDPSATGLLILCTGKRTRDVSEFMGFEKEYEAEIVLGERTASFDADTPVVERRPTEGISPEQVRDVLRGFVGTQLQVPPMWSAAKVGGRRLYEYARRGIEVDRTAREIVISSIVPTEIAIPIVRCTVVCSKGTYIRTLADDVGARLGCGAHLTNLRRTRIGPYHIRDAWTLDELKAHQVAQTGGA